jgi:hypothetical protein
MGWDKVIIGRGKLGVFVFWFFILSGFFGDRYWDLSGSLSF